MTINIKLQNVSVVFPVMQALNVAYLPRDVCFAVSVRTEKEAGRGAAP